MQTKTYERHRHKDPEFPIIFHEDVLYRSRPSVPVHWHENLEILYFIEGQGRVTAEGISEKAGPGDMIVINSGQLHEIVTEQNSCRYYCLIVDKVLCDSFQLPIGELRFSMKVRQEETKRLWHVIVEEMVQKKPYYMQRVKVASLELVLYLCRSASLPPEEGRAGRSRRTEMVKKAVEYIQGNYNRALTIEEIAEAMGLSKYYFCRAFKEVTGYSVVEYVNFLRCGQARRLLKSGKYNVGQSAALSGYANLSYFTRIYKRQFGCLPSEEMQT